MSFLSHFQFCPFVLLLGSCFQLCLLTLLLSNISTFIFLASENSFDFCLFVLASYLLRSLSFLRITNSVLEFLFPCVASLYSLSFILDASFECLLILDCVYFWVELEKLVGKCVWVFLANSNIHSVAGSFLWIRKETFAVWLDQKSLMPVFCWSL